MKTADTRCTTVTGRRNSDGTTQDKKRGLKTVCVSTIDLQRRGNMACVTTQPVQDCLKSVQSVWRTDSSVNKTRTTSITEARPLQSTFPNSGSPQNGEMTFSATVGLPRKHSLIGLSPSFQGSGFVFFLFFCFPLFFF